MKRRAGLILVFGAALPLAAASIAWACGVLATVSLDKKVAAPGSAITATGKNYSTSGDFGPVSLRLSSRDGRVLATTVVAANNINQAFILPADVKPGWYVVMATQHRISDGTPKSGTPGRTTLRVQGSAAQGAAAAPWTGSGPSGPAAPGGGLLTMLLATGLSLTMLAGGWTLVNRKGRSLAPAPLGI